MVTSQSWVAAIAPSGYSASWLPQLTWRDTIRIIIPRLDVQPRGAVGATEVSRGYVGTAVSQPDYEAAVLLQEQLRPNVFASFPREVRDWISGKLTLTAAVNPIIELAPAPSDAPFWLRCHSETNLILLGGPVYNVVADHYPKHEGTHFTFTRGAAGAGWDVQSVRGGTPGGLGHYQGPGRAPRAGMHTTHRP